MNPEPISATELEEALDVLRRASSHFTPSGYASRVLAAARSLLADLHFKAARQGHVRRAAAKLEDTG